MDAGRVCTLALNCAQLPESGGDRPQLVVTVDYHTLRGKPGVATLDTGERLSPANVRRLACDAQLLPAVLNAASQPLDLGRTRRLVSGPLRRALVLRDGGCTFPGCDRLHRWAHAHHLEPWATGGKTSLDNTALLCGHHHRVIHKGEWRIRIAADGRPEFIPPERIDRQRRPRRNPYHRRE